MYVAQIDARGDRQSLGKKSLSERDICSKFMLPAVRRAGWDLGSQAREEVYFTKGRIIVHGKIVSRGARQKDVVLCYKPGIPISVPSPSDL